MSSEKIRIFLQSFESNILNEACDLLTRKISEELTNTKLKGPVSLPTKKRKYCLLRSPHVDKDSREQFEIRRYKKIIDIYPESSKILETLLKIDLPSGVAMNVKLQALE